MRLRDMVPPAARPAARTTFLAVAAATTQWRLEPSFVIVGGQRCGTTSMFQHLAEHPAVRRPPVEKGTDYYTLHSYRSLEWYRRHFPLRLPAAGPRHDTPVSFEACTYYLFHPFALERLARDFPQMRLVAMLRDPVERAFSAYKHELARGFETETDFDRALDLEKQRLTGEVERMRVDPTYESFSHRHHAYVSRGHYAEQLERALRHFPREQLLVIESESFFADPAQEYRRLTDFLGLSRYEPAAFEQHNARPSAPMPQRTRARLQHALADDRERLTEILGRPPRWSW